MRPTDDDPLIFAVRRADNDQFMELLFWIDALKRASATSVTAVIPYSSHAKVTRRTSHGWLARAEDGAI